MQSTAASFCTTKRRISGLAVSCSGRPEGSMFSRNYACAYRLRALLRPASACLFDAALAWRGFGPGGGAPARPVLQRGRAGFLRVQLGALLRPEATPQSVHKVDHVARPRHVSHLHWLPRALRVNEVEHRFLIMIL